MKQILIVEDDSFLNKMLDYNLTADGYGVTSALNARTAADAIRQREFDLVLLDINLPDGDGFGLFRTLRTESDVPALFLSARDADADRLFGLGLGADDYLTKPFSVEELLARIRTTLRRLSYVQIGMGASDTRRHGLERHPLRPLFEQQIPRGIKRGTAACFGGETLSWAHVECPNSASRQARETTPAYI